MSNPIAVHIKDLKKSFGKIEALLGISFDIKPGEIFGLLGPNGAGKSTIINILVGMAMRDSGTATVFGCDVEKDYLATRSMIGVVHQELTNDNFFTVERTLMYQSGFNGVKANDAWIEEILTALDLAPHRNKTFKQLSGGMKRRLMVAKAMVHKPDLLILDEPTAGVDVSLRRSLWEYVRRLNESGTTVILTTHYIKEAQEMCDRIAIINHGKLVTLEKTEDILARLNEKRLIVRLENRAGELSDKLNRFNPVAREDGEVLDFAIHPGTGDIREILGQLHDDRLVLADINVQENDLEDIFVQLTNGGEDNG